MILKRQVCPACLFLAKTTTMDYCLHLHAPLVLMRTSISCRLKKSVHTNVLMSTLTALESTLFSPQRCIIVDTTIRNPTKFSSKRNYSVPQPMTPMSQVGKSVRNSTEFRDFSDFGPFGLRNFHRNFIFPIVKCVPANSEHVFSGSESSPAIYSSDFMNRKIFPPWHNFAPNLHLLM